MKKFVFRKSLLILGGILGLSGCTSATPTPTPVVVTETNLLYKDDLKDSYKVGDVFDNLIGNGGLQVSVLKSDGSTSDLNKTNFAYSLLLNNTTEFDGHTAFTQAGSYKVTISKTDLTDICYYITVKPGEHVHTYSTDWTSNATGHWHAATCEHVQMFTDFGNHVDEDGDYICDVCKFILEPIPERVVLTEIKASGYTTQVYQGDVYSFDGKVTASYSDGNTKEVTTDCDFEELKTDTLGTFTKNITYSENGIEKTTTYIVKVVEKTSEIILVNSLSLNKENLPIVEGDVYKLLATILPENATNKTLSWLSSNDSVVAVNDGTITAKAVGTATITAKTTDGSNLFSTCNVTVEAKSPEKILVTDLLLDTTSSTLHIGDTLTINSSVEPYNATNKTLSWSSSKSTVASVSNGVVTAKAVGTTTITAKTTDGSNISATCSITVEAIKVSEIQLSLDSTEINVGESKTITAKVLPENAANKSVTWSTNSSSVATVTSAGVVKGIAKGKAVITATAKDGSGVKGTIEVNVNPILVTSISLTPNEVEVGVGSTQQLSASVLPSNATNKNIVWSSSDSNVATVSTSGLVTAKAPGNVTITATAKDGSEITGTAKIVTKSIMVTSISVSPSSPSIAVGKTQQMSATVSPTNATNKEVTWSSSNTSVASISPTGLVTANATGSTTIKATAKDGSTIYGSTTLTVTEFSGDAWTIMIYMCGSTLEYDASDRDYGPNIGLASDDLMQILKSNAIPDDVNVIVETGGAGGWSLNKSYTTTKTTISSSKLQRWEVVSQKDSTSNNKLKPIETLSTNQMAKQDSFQSFLEWGLTSYPAENTGVIMWNHGGALGGVCYDENYNENALNTIEIAKASEDALKNSGADKMTFIGYDACLMGVADIASVNADYYKYMVASEESEPGSGWDYTTLCNTLYSKKENTTSNIESILGTICTSFIKENCDNGGCGQYYPGEGYYYCYSTLAAYDLSKMGTMITEFNSYASNIKKVSGYFNKIESAFSSSKNYVFGEGLYGTSDFIKFLDAMDSKFSSVSSTNLRNAVNSLVIAKDNCDEYNFTPCGICAFTPICNDSYYGLQCSESDYTGSYASKFTTWQEMMLNNW